MDTTIRKLDRYLYRALKARAALEGKGIGELMNEAIESYLNRPSFTGRLSLANLKPEDYPSGCEHLSEEIDMVVYGV